MAKETISESFELILAEVLEVNKKCNDMTVPDIKAELKSRNLKTSGRKTFIVKRLSRAKSIELFSGKTNKELRVELKARGLPVAGKKEDKIER